MSALGELHLWEGVAVQAGGGDPHPGGTAAAPASLRPAQRIRAVRDEAAAGRADHPRHVLNAALLCFTALGGLEPAREDPAPPSELPVRRSAAP